MEKRKNLKHMTTLFLGLPALLHKGRFSQEGRIYALFSTMIIDVIILLNI